MGNCEPCSIDKCKETLEFRTCEFTCQVIPITSSLFLLIINNNIGRESILAPLIECVDSP